MKSILLIVFSCFIIASFGQRHSLEGVWQGIISSHTENYDKGKAFWMNFDVDEGTNVISGASRIEKPYTEYFAYKPLKGKTLNDSVLQFEEINIRKQNNSSRLIWCKYKGELTYNSRTGYLEGDWVSTDCNRTGGKLILYRSKYQISKTDTNTLYHSWFDNLVGDLQKGWKAYYVRDAEMRDFEFVPVYFDHDKDSLKPEFHAYLQKMSKIVVSHSDLRIKIIGHTDSNGTDEYNVGLSQRRADVIKAFLVNSGIPSDRVIIEFRGEKDPATSNATAKGKSLNRRVDFQFI
jgi:outer membrane protein OmpA-like peptidoglycan-associated protein